MKILKNAVKGFARIGGYEICRLYDSELAELPPGATFSYKEAQAYRALGNLGQLSIGEARFLSTLVAASDPTRPIIEIGTLFGFSSIVMALAKPVEQALITVDSYQWNPLGVSRDTQIAIVANRLAPLVSDHNVRIVVSDKDEFYRRYSGPPPALFFCDADHSYEATLADISWARSVGATIICGDDYNHPYQDGVKRAVDEIGGPRQIVEGLFVV